MHFKLLVDFSVMGYFALISCSTVIMYLDVLFWILIHINKCTVIELLVTWSDQLISQKEWLFGKDPTSSDLLLFESAGRADAVLQAWNLVLESQEKTLQVKWRQQMSPWESLRKSMCVWNGKIKIVLKQESSWNVSGKLKLLSKEYKNGVASSRQKQDSRNFENTQN